MMRTPVPQRFSKQISGFFLFLCISLLPRPTLAQSVPQRSLITQPVDENNLTVLKGNAYPLARAEFDRGVAPLSLPMDRMLLVLKRSPEQESALGSLLDEQQDKSSPNFHNWLTPEQFGQQFGPSDGDIQTVTGWLRSHGFQAIQITKGRTIIEFSGTAGQVQEAFRTAIHKYDVDGAEHWANATDPQIPSALTPVVAGVFTLHNFYKATEHVVSDQQFTAKYTPGSTPQFTSSNGLHALMPADFATIYNVSPTYAAGTDGTGEFIAVVGRTNIQIQDILGFRELTGLPFRITGVVLNGPDPGDLGGGEEVEAVLDATWSGAVAQNATVILVVSASTNTTDGVDLSELYIVDNNAGDVMTESFGGCELNRTSAEASAISSLAQQAAAQGITYLVSTGDNGAEGCDNPRSPLATHPLSVNILAATPFNVAVGGTQFTENGKDSAYWNITNNPTTLGSAKSYIPENVWNESCATNCGTRGPNLFAGSGGFSTLFSKPIWQAGVPGIPSDGARDLPDVSLSAAGHDPYLICIQGSCVPDSQGFVHFAGISGTSASAPSFAGIMALVDQKTGERQGQANYVLYRMAAQETLSSCNASSQSGLPASNCIFNDVTIGNNAVPGETGFGTPSAKYQSSVGYDLATGLGSVNVTNLVNGWASTRTGLSNVTLSFNPPSGVTHGTPISFTVAVAQKSGMVTPTGDVSLLDLSTPNGSKPFSNLTLVAGSATGSTNQIPGGTSLFTAHYEGDGVFVPADSAQVAVNISQEPSTTLIAALTGSSTNMLTPFTTGPYGGPVLLQGTVTGQSGVGSPSGGIVYTDNGQSLGSFDVIQGKSLSPSIFTFAAGQHTIAGEYLGDQSFKLSDAPSIQFKITQAATTSTVQQVSTPIVAGQSTTILVVINTISHGTSPTGTATLFDGNSQLGGAAPVSPITGGPTAQGQASFQISQFTAGQHTLTANYTGDSNYSASLAPALILNVVRPASVSVSSSNPSAQQGTNITFTAVVTPSQPGGPLPTGVVVFTADGSAIGAPVNLSNGQAQASTNSLPPATFTILANYSGDSNYAGGSAIISQTITPGPVFAVVANPQTITVSSPGSSGSTTLTFTGMNGFTGTLNFSPPSCTGLPSESSCSFSPASVTLNGTTTSGMTILTVSTMAPSNVAPHFVQPPAGNIWLMIGIGTALAFFFLLSLPTRARRWNAALGVLAFAVLLGFAACGGGGGGGGGPHDPGTPIGVDPNVVVSISSGGVSHNIQLIVNVQ